MNISNQEHELLTTLVEAITGLKAEYVMARKPEIAEQCWDVYSNFVHNYFAKNFSQKDFVLLQSAAKHELPEPQKSYLQSLYSQATEAFVAQLSTK